MFDFYERNEFFRIFLNFVLAFACLNFKQFRPACFAARKLHSCQSVDIMRVSRLFFIHLNSQYFKILTEGFPFGCQFAPQNFFLTFLGTYDVETFNCCTVFGLDKPL